MYRTGPTNLFLAFGPYLGSPYMDCLYQSCIFISRKDVISSMAKDERLLNHYLTNLQIGNNKDISQKISEIIVAEMALLRERSMRYPVVVIGLEDKIKQDGIDHFKMLGYDSLIL